jgi:hypothetical protein
MPDEPTPPKSPQQKKALSYAKDRRNNYGENDKASRKAIPRRKAIENRSNRRTVGQLLSKAPDLDEPALDLVESSARHDLGRIGGWTKEPDTSLVEHVKASLEQRAFRVSAKKRRKLSE